MGTIQSLKAIWKRLRINGQVKNYSLKTLWVLETDSGKPNAHLLLPMTKSLPQIDADAFKRKDGSAIDGHTSWWKFYDFSTVEVFDHGTKLRVSVISKVAVDDKEFDKEGIINYDQSRKWGSPIQLVTDVSRNKKKRIVQYHVTGIGWISKKEALKLCCNGEIDNGRPVFPKGRQPYIRTRRDNELFNNLSILG